MTHDMSITSPSSLQRTRTCVGEGVAALGVWWRGRGSHGHRRLLSYWLFRGQTVTAVHVTGWVITCSLWKPCLWGRGEGDREEHASWWMESFSKWRSIKGTVIFICPTSMQVICLFILKTNDRTGALQGSIRFQLGPVSPLVSPLVSPWPNSPLKLNQVASKCTH